MDLGLFSDVTARYRARESWLYDHFIAPGVATWFEPAHAHLARVIAPGTKLLDVGSGGGQFLAYLAERHPGAAFTGVDKAPEQVARARARLRGGGIGADVVEGDAMALPFTDGHFDVVLSFLSIKHWPDQARGLSECVRVLRPGGFLLVAEGDRGARLDVARAFLDVTRIPGPLRAPLLPVFRTWVLGQGLDLEDLRAFAAQLDLATHTIERMADAPVVVLFGQRRA